MVEHTVADVMSNCISDNVSVFVEEFRAVGLADRDVPDVVTNHMFGVVYLEEKGARSEGCLDSRQDIQ